MPPKEKPREPSTAAAAAPDAIAIFRGVAAFLAAAAGVQPRRLQVWRNKLAQLGGAVEDALSDRVTHVLAMDAAALRREVRAERLRRFRGNVVSFQWLEDCLKAGRKLPEDLYALNIEDVNEQKKVVSTHLESHNLEHLSGESPQAKRSRKSPDHGEIAKYRNDNNQNIEDDNVSNKNRTTDGSDHTDPQGYIEDASSQKSSPYSPPDLNRNITEIFGKLINVYRALGDERRSFSYYKAIPVIEKLPFKIESVEQVKHLPAIGKSLQDHMLGTRWLLLLAYSTTIGIDFLMLLIQEIVTTGKLATLEHFENDEKVRTVTMFGEVWGIGPTTALKLYDKGYRSLDDLRKDDSLTHAQRIGLQFFDDIKQRIPRNEVRDIEALLQKIGDEILPGVIIVCGGSYRRGKSSCGDMDIIITHPDGESHRGFLSKFVRKLKDDNFLREELVFKVHSIEGSDAGVDTYFGLCTYPGRELRHRIDFKVYPRERYAFGLVAWTGNDVLNRRLRLIAESKGYRLDDTGLYLATQGSGRKRGIRSNAIIHCKTEKDVFDVLGVPWLEPHERNL